MSDEQSLTRGWRRNDDGHLIHDGDCYFWDRRVCTCGLLHHLRPMISARLELMPDFFKQDMAQRVVMERLLGSKLVKEANVVMTRDLSRPMTAEECAEYEAALRKAGFSTPKDAAGS